MNLASVRRPVNASLMLGFYFLISLVFSTSASAGTIVQCGAAECSSTFSIYIDGASEEVGGGMIWYDAETGDISLDTSHIRGGGMVDPMSQGLMWNLDDGSQIMVNSVFGNADPVLGFGLGASTGATGRSFTFSFDLPIALEGAVEASSSVSYSLTSTTEAGAQILPLGGNVVNAYDVDTSIPSIGSLDKNVAVGDAFGFSGGPQTQNSPVYTASSMLTADLAYDLMTAQIAFTLSPNSSVGISGFVQQVPVPLPATLPLLLVALSGLGILKYRSGKA